MFLYILTHIECRQWPFLSISTWLQPKFVLIIIIIISSSMLYTQLQLPLTCLSTSVVYSIFHRNLLLSDFISIVSFPLLIDQDFTGSVSCWQIAEAVQENLGGLLHTADTHNGDTLNTRDKSDNYHQNIQGAAFFLLKAAFGNKIVIVINTCWNMFDDKK